MQGKLSKCFTVHFPMYSDVELFFMEKMTRRSLAKVDVSWYLLVRIMMSTFQKF